MMPNKARSTACHWVVERHNHLNATGGCFCDHQDIKKDTSAVQRYSFACIAQEDAFAHFKSVLQFSEGHAEKFAVHSGPRAHRTNARKLISATNNMHATLVIECKFNIGRHRA